MSTILENDTDHSTNALLIHSVICLIGVITNIITIILLLHHFYNVYTPYLSIKNIDIIIIYEFKLVINSKQCIDTII